jgi:enoyl-CoA hydratase/carnithine racemase
VTAGVSCHRDDAVLRIVLEKPEKLNAVNTPMLVALREAISAAANDDSVRVVTLTGAGRAFCAGGDVGGENLEGAGSAAAEAIAALTESPKPVIAGVRGAAVGVGCSLALACDLAVVAQSAFFQLSFTKIGLMTDGGASALIPAAIGRARTARMALLAEKITATTAFEWGMISHVVPDEAYDAEFEAVAQALAVGPTLSYGWIKRALRTATLSELGETQSVEVEGQEALHRSADVREGVRAFRERREPRFRGR